MYISLVDGERRLPGASDVAQATTGSTSTVNGTAYQAALLVGADAITGPLVGPLPAAPHLEATPLEIAHTDAVTVLVDTTHRAAVHGELLA